MVKESFPYFRRPDIRGLVLIGDAYTSCIGYLKLTEEQCLVGEDLDEPGIPTSFGNCPRRLNTQCSYHTLIRSLEDNSHSNNRNSDDSKYSDLRKEVPSVSNRNPSLLIHSI